MRYSATVGTFVRGCAVVMLVAVPAMGNNAIAQDGAALSDAARPGGSLIVAPGREFAADSLAHRPLPADAAIDPKSAVWVANLQRQIKQYYGGVAVNTHNYTPPLYIVGPDQPTVRVRAARVEEPTWSFPPLQQQWEAVPLPDDFQPSQGTDKEAIIYQPSTGRYWEFWVMEKTGGKTTNSAGKRVAEWRAAWGGRIDDLKTNPGYFITSSDGVKFGTSATGIALLAGLMTIEEQKRGAINHPVHFAIPESRQSFWSFPAQRTDGQIDDENAIPQGTIFRLPANLDLDEIEMDPYARMIARAVQRYGMVLRDTAGAVVFYAENPGGRYATDPYYGRDGILKCPKGKFEWSCAPDSNNRLYGFPWHKLQALKVTLVRSPN